MSIGCPTCGATNKFGRTVVWCATCGWADDGPDTDDDAATTLRESRKDRDGLEELRGILQLTEQERHDMYDEDVVQRGIRQGVIDWHDADRLMGGTA